MRDSCVISSARARRGCSARTPAASCSLLHSKRLGTHKAEVDRASFSFPQVSSSRALQHDCRMYAGRGLAHSVAALTRSLIAAEFTEV